MKRSRVRVPLAAPSNDYTPKNRQRHSFCMTYQIIKSQYQQNKLGWQKSFLEGLSQDAQGSALPWMTYPFIEFITKKLQTNHTIFEFGSGSSTLFFAPKVQKIVALESNKKWYKIIRAKLDESSIGNVELTLMEDALENSAYENYTKNFSEKFDFIIIDSLKRFACAQNVISALKPGGSIILDDSERANYKKIFNFFAENNFQKQDFFGIAPGQFRIKNTTLFSKNEKN